MTFSPGTFSLDSAKRQPFSPMCQWTEVKGIMSSRPLSLRTMRARWAGGVSLEREREAMGDVPQGQA